MPKTSYKWDEMDLQAVIQRVRRLACARKGTLLRGLHPRSLCHHSEDFWTSSTKSIPEVTTSVPIGPMRTALGHLQHNSRDRHLLAPHLDSLFL